VGGLEGTSLKPIFSLLAAAIGAAYGVIGYAQTPVGTTLEPVVVTASRVSEPQGQATVLVEVISRQQIEDSGAANITELLDQASGGLLTRQYGRLGVDASFDLGYLGGASAQRTLILVDGVRLNEIDDATVPWGQLPLDAIERVEIRKAAGGVLFGDRALGGVVNFITRRSDHTGSAQITLGSFGTRIIGLHKNASHNGTEFQVSAQSAETDGYRRDAHQSLESGQFRIAQATALGTFSLAARVADEKGDRPAALSLADFHRDPRIASLIAPGYFYRARREGESLDLTWSQVDRERNEYASRISQERNQSTATFISPGYVGAPTRYQNRRNGFEARRASTFEYGRIIGGIDHTDARSRSNRAQRAQVDQISSSAYLQAELALGSQMLSLGGRYQRIENRFMNTAASNRETSKESLNALSLGGRTPLGAGQLRYSLQSAFAFPTADQLYTYQAGWPYEPVDIFPGVRAMRSNEAQVSYAVMASWASLEAGLRRIVVRDEIGEKLNCVGEGISCNTNLYDTSRHILFFGGRGILTSRLAWTVHADLVDTRIETGSFVGNAVPLVPRLSIKSGTALRASGGIYRLMVSHRGDMVQSGDYSNEKFRIPTRTTFDLGYEYTREETRSSLAVWVRNLTDRSYFDFAAWDGFSSGVAPADGRTLEIRLRQSF
jgi:outer membrane cobalamin receptor